MVAGGRCSPAGDEETTTKGTRDMDNRNPSIIDLNPELAKLTMFRRTPKPTRAETRGSVARLASYRDRLLMMKKL
jgi:hypothetical protein